jgi:DNA-binding MarR family transcriptional regulator
MAHMAADRPLSALLSNALVAFTIEFDNEFEHQAPHRTTNHGRTPGSSHVPWLVSMVMWSRWLRFVPDDGISLGDRRQLSQASPKEMRLWLTRLGPWWNYVTIDPGGGRAPSQKPGPGWIVHPTPGGRKALEVWRPLTEVVEGRWRARHGQSEIERLCASLRALVDRFDYEPPGWLPILGYGLFATEGDDRQDEAPANRDAWEKSLPALLSKALRTFAIEFEGMSDVSLAISANVLRLVGDDGVPLSNLPALAGVSTEAIAMAVGFLRKRGYAKVEPDTRGSRRKSLRLSSKGRAAKDAYQQITWAIERRWEEKYGERILRDVRESLERTVGEGSIADARLFRGLQPYPDGWRASMPPPNTLPEFPMVLHRGGFPDGS